MKSFHTSGFTPATIASRAIRTYIPYSACLKYAARGSESNSDEISSTRGRGCITIIRRRALVINCGVTTSSPRVCNTNSISILNGEFLHMPSQFCQETKPIVDNIFFFIHCFTSVDIL